MACDEPLNIANPNRMSDTDFKRIIVPCGKCASCYKTRADAWFIRLFYEQKRAVSAHFVTLTYAHPPRTFNDLYTVKKEDLQNFFKRLRKLQPYNHSIKYYAVSEYGDETQRPHYHAVIFNNTDERYFDKAWSLESKPIGQIHVGTVTKESIYYVTSYIGKRISIPVTDYDDRTKEFSLMSKRMGQHYIQSGAIRFHNQEDKSWTQIDGIKYPLPRYYKNLIFPHYKLKGIGKRNYENYLKNQARNALNFPSFLDFERNQWALREARNVDFKTSTQSKL